MKKVIVFLGGPRKNGYTTMLVNNAIEGVKANGAEVILYDLNDSGIRGCQGCNYCRTHEDGCAVKDYLTPMYQDIAEADGMIFTSPIYYYQITGQAKLWLDRTYPFIGPEATPRHPSKNILGIYAHGEKNEDAYKDVIAYMDRFFTYYGWSVVENILATGTTSPQYIMPEELLERAYEAGKALVQ